jgi:hypothetical protein
MQRSGLERLSHQLREPPGAAISALDDEHLAHLAGALHDVRVRQAEALASAAEQAMNHIPRLLRGPVRKIVG